MLNDNDNDYMFFKSHFELLDIPSQLISLNSVDQQFIKQIFDTLKLNGLNIIFDKENIICCDYINNKGTQINILYYHVISKLYVACGCETSLFGRVKCTIRVMNYINNLSSQRDIELCSEFGKIIHSNIQRELMWIERRHAILFGEGINSTTNCDLLIFLLNDYVFKEIMSYI
jgi:hypothetical protein